MSLSHRTWSIRTHFVHSRAGLPRPVFETTDDPANPHPHDPPSRNPSLPRELSNRRQRPQQNNIHRKQPTPPKRPTHPIPDRNLPLDRIIPYQTETIQLHRTQQSSGDTKHSNMDLRRSPPNSHTWLLPNRQLNISTTRNMVI